MHYRRGRKVGVGGEEVCKDGPPAPPPPHTHGRGAGRRQSKTGNQPQRQTPAPPTTSTATSSDAWDYPATGALRMSTRLRGRL